MNRRYRRTRLAADNLSGSIPLLVLSLVEFIRFGIFQEVWSALTLPDNGL